MRRSLFALPALAGLVVAGAASAAPMGPTPVDTWTTLATNNPNFVLGNASTNAPTLSDNPASDGGIATSLIAGEWGSTVALEIGETIVLSGDVTWHGAPGTSGGANPSTGGAAIRFGLFSGAPALVGGNGYVIDDHKDYQTDNTLQGVFTAGTSGAITSSSGATALGEGTPVELGNWENDVVYSFVLSVTRTGADSADISIQITTSAGLATPVTPITMDTTVTDAAVSGGSGSLTFDFFAWTFGGTYPPTKSLEADAAEFSNVFVQVIPEPASLGLIALGAVALIRRRRA